MSYGHLVGELRHKKGRNLYFGVGMYSIAQIIAQCVIDLAPVGGEFLYQIYTFIRIDHGILFIILTTIPDGIF